MSDIWMLPDIAGPLADHRRRVAASTRRREQLEAERPPDCGSS